MTASSELLVRLHRLRRVGLIMAAVAGIACAIGYLVIRQRFYPAYLTAYLYFLAIALGCLALSLVHGMTGGGWGRSIRRVIEAGYETLPLMAILFVPIWMGASQIYPWADPEEVGSHPVLARKAGYLNLTGFHLRAIIYFALWVAATWVLNRSSPNEERSLDSPRSRRLQRDSGLGFIMYGVTCTLAAVDWVMSLEPEWYSTMYGLIQMAGQGVSGLSFALIVVVALRSFEPWSQLISPDRLNDLGNLLLAAVMFWAYCSYFQYLVIWSGNLPEENIWYVHRSQGGWQLLAPLLMALHFAVPFLLLLSRRMKRQSTDLARIAGLLLAVRYVDLYWQTVPGFRDSAASSRGLAPHWLDLAAFAAVGGAWLAVFAWRLSARAQLPLYDPELHEVVGD
jgi:hypothetical protein